jgi:hypothetical protein
MQPHPDSDVVMESVRGVAGCAPASVGQIPKWTLTIQNGTDTRRNLHQLLKGKQPYSVLHGVYTDVLHDLKAVPKETPPKGKQPRAQLLHLCSSRNSVRKEDKSGNLQMTPTKEPRSLEYPPPTAVEA